MAINNPLTEGTDAAGGYLVPDDVARQTLIAGLLTETPTLSLSNSGVTSSKRVRIPVMTDFPEASFVNETAPKPTSGGEFSQIELNVKKIAVIVPFSDELLEDAVQDPTVLMSDEVRKSFSRTIEKHLIGCAGSAGVFTTSFDNCLEGVGTYTVLGSEGDALRLAISESMADVEANGYTPNGVILPSDARRHLRDARKTVETTDPVYAAADWAYGMRTAYSSALYPVSATPAYAPVAVVGDWSHLLVRIRSDISVASSNQATITIGENQVNLWEQNMTALRFEMRIGANLWDGNRAFSKIVTADD